jgi:hypothetical protein
MGWETYTEGTGKGKGEKKGRRNIKVKAELGFYPSETRKARTNLKSWAKCIRQTVEPIGLEDAPDLLRNILGKGLMLLLSHRLHCL